MNPHNDHTYDAGCTEHTTARARGLFLAALVTALILTLILGVFGMGVQAGATPPTTPTHNFIITPEPTYGISVSCTFDNTPVVGDGAVVSQGEVAGLCHDVNVGTANQTLLANSLGHVVWSNGDRLGAIATRRRVVIALGGR